MGDFATHKGVRSQGKGGLKEKLKPVLSRGLETSGTPDLGNGEEPFVGTCTIWLGITQGGTSLVPCSSRHLLMPKRMCPTHGGWWKQNMESAVGRENDVMFLLNMFKVFEN